jgi:hypothetical protein
MMWIPETVGQFLGQVQTPGARHPYIHFLQQDDIGIMVCQYRGNALRTETAVKPDAPVDII